MSLINYNYSQGSLVARCAISHQAVNWLTWVLNSNWSLRLTVSGNLILSSLVCQVKENKQQCCLVWRDEGDLQKDTDYCYSPTKLDVFWIPCQGFRFTPRGNKWAPNASLVNSWLHQLALILKANFSWSHISWGWHTKSKKLKSWPRFCSACQEQSLVPWGLLQWWHTWEH